MRSRMRQALTKRLQKLFWIYVTKNFVVTQMSDVRRDAPVANSCKFTPITFDNFARVNDFREQSRISEYQNKLALGEIGFFAEVSGAMAGSIWATINKERAPTVVRTYMKLFPNDALIHDIVTSEKLRGKGIGLFMVGQISSILLNEHHVNRIIIDVSVRNKASLRMMHKAGVPLRQKVLCVSALGRLVFHKALKQY
jgi:RimJ/RimL family protein N-acetyltransferase